MLAFSNDYYGFIFRATQSVELFCAYLKYTIKAKSITHPIEIRYQAIAGWNVPPENLANSIFENINAHIM